MELARESKNHFTVSMSSAVFEMIQRRNHVELSVEFTKGDERNWMVPCSDMFEALSRVSDYYQTGRLTDPKGKFPWVTDDGKR